MTTTVVEEIIVKMGKETIFTIEKEVFKLLFDNTIVRRKSIFTESLTKGTISFNNFIALARKGEVPYPLFFLKLEHAKKVVEEFQKKVYFGVSKNQLSIASRGDIVLADISLLLKDITRKQSYLKKFYKEKNNIPGKYRKSNKSLESKAQEVRELIGYDITQIFSLNKEESFRFLDTCLSKHNVFISLYAHQYTPQNIDKSLQFSGIAINDKYCPYLFIKAGDNDSRIELWGRRLFTAALLLSCLLHGECRPVTMDGSSHELPDNKHYLFAEEFLMPENMFRNEICSTYEDIDRIATKYSVSPSAVVMRLYRLKMINDDTKNIYLDSLSEKWRKVTRAKGGGNNVSMEEGIRRYNNRAVVNLVVHNFLSNEISEHDARNLLCYKKGEKLNIEVLQHE